MKKFIKIMFFCFFYIILVSNKAYAGEIAVYDSQTNEETIYTYDDVCDEYDEVFSQPSIPLNSMSLSDVISNSYFLNNIIGTDDRQLITNATSFPYCAMARIIVTHQDGSVSYGSGAIIGPRLVATAGHVLLDGNNGISFPSSITVTFGLYGTTYVTSETSYSGIVYSPYYNGDGTTSADYGFIKLTNVMTATTGYLGTATAVHQGQSIIAAGYPGYGSSLYICDGGITTYDDDVMEISADFTAGQSGGPIYNYYEGSPYFKGVISGNYNEHNYVRRYEPNIRQWLIDNGYFS